MINGIRSRKPAAAVPERIRKPDCSGVILPGGISAWKTMFLIRRKERVL